MKLKATFSMTKTLLGLIHATFNSFKCIKEKCQSKVCIILYIQRNLQYDYIYNMRLYRSCIGLCVFMRVSVRVCLCVMLYITEGHFLHLQACKIDSNLSSSNFLFHCHRLTDSFSYITLGSNQSLRLKKENKVHSEMYGHLDILQCDIKLIIQNCQEEIR